MDQTVKGVIFDHSTLFVDDPQLINEIRILLDQLLDRGLYIGVFSTRSFDLNSELRARRYPFVDLFLTRADVGGANKGAPEWLQEAAWQWDIETHHLVYVGDQKRDWLTALNGGSFYFHAKWCGTIPSGVTTAFVASTPSALFRFLSHFLLIPPRWAYSLDSDEFGVHVRSLVDASIQLSATSQRSFGPKDIFTYNQDISVGGHKARDILMLHAFSSLYLEGHLAGSPGYVVYPSSTPDKENPVIEQFVKPVATTFHGYTRFGLLVRAKQSKDTSIERSRRRPVSFADQTNTVRLNPGLRSFIRDRSIIVFDDFTTTGMSLDWARNLLFAASAKQVILVTVGKFGASSYQVYLPNPDVSVNPFRLDAYNPDDDFHMKKLRMTYSPRKQRLVQESFRHFAANEDLPPMTG